MSLSLRKSSFVYRMTAKAWGFFDINPSPSLCGFFWQMVLSPFIFMIGAIMSISAVLGLLWVLFYAVGGLFMMMFESFLPDSWFLLKGEFNWRFIVSSLIVWLSLATGGGLWFYSKHRREVKIEEGTYKPSVTIEFIKAKKRKICPFIDFK